MKDTRPPLSYAIIKLFADGRRRCAEDVVKDLENDYYGYKLLAEKDVEETLITARENGLLNESGIEVGNDGTQLCVYFELNDYGRKMIKQYL